MSTFLGVFVFIPHLVDDPPPFESGEPIIDYLTPDLAYPGRPCLTCGVDASASGAFLFVVAADEVHVKADWDI